MDVGAFGVSICPRNQTGLLKSINHTDTLICHPQVQIHGPVSLSENVECIVVNPRHKTDSLSTKLLDRFVEQNKCNLIWMDPDDLTEAVPSSSGATAHDVLPRALPPSLGATGHDDLLGVVPPSSRATCHDDLPRALPSSYRATSHYPSASTSLLGPYARTRRRVFSGSETE